MPIVYLAHTPSLDSFHDCSVCSVLVACDVLAVLEVTESVCIDSCICGLEVDLRIGMFDVFLTAASVSQSIGYYNPFNSCKRITLADCA